MAMNNDAIPLPDDLEFLAEGFSTFPTYGILVKLKECADGINY